MKTIYLTDDDEDDRMLVRSTMESIVGQIKIVELESGDHLLHLLRQQPLNTDSSLIILDMNMPRMNGIETLSVLKNEPLLKHIPVIMMSTTAHHDLVKSAYRLGVNAFVAKPVFEKDFIRLGHAINACFLNASESSVPLSHGSSVKKGSIVVIEDNRDHLFFIRRAINLSMPGVQIIEYRDADHVVRHLDENWKKFTSIPQLILLDLYLPTRQQGLELLVDIQKMLAARNCQSVPIVVFTYSTKKEDMHASYQHNANGYMIKSRNADRWKDDFVNLHNFWWNTVSHY